MLRFVLAALLCLVASVASAQPARDAFDQGVAAFRRGRYEIAIEAWNESFRLESNADVKFNLAQAHERLGHFVEARDAYEYFLAHGRGDAETFTEARIHIDALNERIASTSIRLVGGSAGGSVSVDGEARGSTPREEPIRVTPGQHRVVVSRPGVADVVVNVTVTAGATIEIELGQESPVVRDNVLAVQTSPASANASTPQPAPSATARPPSFPVVPVTLMAVGGASAITGVVLGVLANSAASDAPTSDGPEADSARALALGADITLFGGLALAATGTILLFVLDTDEEAPVVAAPVASPGFIGASARVRF